MRQEKYSLTWHTYSDHLRSMMKELMMNEDFSDVILVTEDKKHIKANINIFRSRNLQIKHSLVRALRQKKSQRRTKQIKVFLKSSRVRRRRVARVHGEDTLIFLLR